MLRKLSKKTTVLLILSLLAILLVTGNTCSLANDASSSSGHISFSDVLQILVPILLTSIIGLMVWIIQKLNSFESWKGVTDVTIASLRVDYERVTKPQTDLKEEIDLQRREVAMHTTQLSALGIKLDIIFRKLEEMESRCLMHKLLQSANADELVRLIATRQHYEQHLDDMK